MSRQKTEAQREYFQKWYAQNKERVKAKQRAYYQANRERSLAYNKQYLYGVSAEQHASMIAEQDNKCAICGFSPSEGDRGLVIDHCHQSKRVRSLLCAKCNTGIGQFKDRPELLERAAEYVRSHAAVTH